MSDQAKDIPGLFEMRAGGTLLAFDARIGERANILYAGPDLPGASGQELRILATRQHAPGGPASALQGSLLNELGTGVSGPAGLIGHRAGYDWALDLRVSLVTKQSDCQIEIEAEDRNTGIAARHTLSIDPDTGLATCSTTIRNLKEAPFAVDWCAALCLPFDPELSRFFSFTGRWAGEFQIEEVPGFHGSIVRENKAGRTSHDVFPGGILTAPETTETSGPALGFHLAWSGNHRLRVDRHSDGRCFVQMGEMAFPGEITLGHGESYQTPDMLFAWSDTGIGDVSRAFHDHLCGTVLDPRGLEKPRPVHYNTWEAVYFGHHPETLIELAEAAADVGAERFVLDDGWFGGRRHDAAGLGDWWVARDVYPDGLGPLVNRVKQLGMEFGLWFEPEMVNPDSELYRAHPDWVLRAEGVDAIPSRNQLTLDLTRQDVCDYLFEKITALVSEYGIDYIKWDMNRDIQHPGSMGRAAIHAQTQAVYRLLANLRASHPELEIESCSSGGGRADFGILRHTDRIWTSDNNDARQRHAIMRGASHFFPLRILGNHVGPRTCHITGRKFSMAYRVASAVFGHMGMELDLRQENARDLAVLKSGIALHKAHRDLIHSGDYYRLHSAQGTVLSGCVARGGAEEALFCFARLEGELPTHPARIHFKGIDPAKRYRVRMVWPTHNPSVSNPSIVDAAGLQGEGGVFSGAALIGHGIQPPLTFPDTAIFYHLKASE